MTRLLNVVLVAGSITALVLGGVLVGRTVRDDATSRLTESIPASAAAATADSQLRAAVFAANTYYVRHSTYEGMTADVLRSEVDAGLAPDVSVEDATAAAFCVQTEVAERTYSYRVRQGFLTPGSGC